MQTIQTIQSELQPQTADRYNMFLLLAFADGSSH